MISDTRHRLKAWGKWVAGGQPQLSSMFRSMNGRGAEDLLEMPPDIAEIDRIVCAAPTDIRALLIRFYGSFGTFTDKCISMNLDKAEVRRATERADYYVHSRLDDLSKKIVNKRQNEIPRQRNSVHSG